MNTSDMSRRRHQMVEDQIANRGVHDPLVLDAMEIVPREEFIPEDLRESAYEDTPLPIDANQTISQPYIVAYMIEALSLKRGQKVLEIGTGSGYAAAVLAQIAGKVYTIERIQVLAEKASETLRSLNYNNVEVLHGDGTKGWPEHAPFDSIIVAASGPSVPDSLKAQLKIGGRIVIPVGTTADNQALVSMTRVSETDYENDSIARVRFVPLIGSEAWKTNP